MNRLKDRIDQIWWRLLHRSVIKDVARSEEVVAEATRREPVLRELPDEELVADIEDLAGFLSVVRETARRALGLRPYDVQLLGAARMLTGQVVEMATGEGKTLTGAIAAAAFAARDRSVHVVSVNDYLARRDAEWMAPLYERLGLTVGWITSSSSRAERRRSYGCDITYASISELGFDVLRDRQCTDIADLIVPKPDARKPIVALVDEADSVMVDEAAVPLVLAGATSQIGPESRIVGIVRTLRSDVHYETDDDGRTASLTEAGVAVVEDALGGINIYAEEQNGEILSQVNLALHAEVLLERDVHYIVRSGRVQLVNQSRGRVATLQRWPDGLQAAVEAKEGLRISQSGEILDSLTVQNLLKRYPTLCGMTGTAIAALEQFNAFYDLEVWQIPPNTPCIRVDEPDRVYDTLAAKERALVDYVGEVHRTGQPILIGTQDVAESERLAGLLTKAEIPCTVLNAKNDAREAAIIAEAGSYRAVTVSTQMAGRGVDIRLGGTGHDRGHAWQEGNGQESKGQESKGQESKGQESGQEGHGPNGSDRVAALGGLCVIGTGRHISRRLDDQLRGRSGRQGDPGRSVFFASLDDSLLHYLGDADLRGLTIDADGRVHGSGPTPALALSQLLDRAQRIANGALLDIHLNTWRYTRLIEDQRTLIDAQRARLLQTDQALRDLEEPCADRLAQLRETVGEPVLVEAARLITLHHLDRCWASHLAFLAESREAIHLRALGRRMFPLDEFNRETIEAFQSFSATVAERSAEAFDAAPIGPGGVDLDLAGLKRPNATWTYMVHDNPLGTELDRILGNLFARKKK